jgi:hypothetical protein
MEEIKNISLVCIEPQKLELSSVPSRKVREDTPDVMKSVVEEISQQTSFTHEKDRLSRNRDTYRNFFDHETTTSRKGQVPEQPTQMQEKRKAEFANQAPISGRPLRLPDLRALHPSWTWPSFETNPYNVTRSLHKKRKKRQAPHWSCNVIMN